LALPVISSPNSGDPQDEQTTVKLTDILGSPSYNVYVGGEDDSRHLNISIANKTSMSVVVEIEEGTVFEPSDSGIQRMAASRDYRVSVHGHVHNEIEIDVDCLDIQKDPPAKGTKSWSVFKSQRVANFTSCLDDALDQLSKADPEHAKSLRQSRDGLLQLAIWQARGATRQQWIHFCVEWQKMSYQGAENWIDQLSPLLKAIVGHCGSLESL
jgi:hypothetical protein